MSTATVTIQYTLHTETIMPFMHMMMMTVMRASVKLVLILLLLMMNVYYSEDNEEEKCFSKSNLEGIFKTFKKILFPKYNKLHILIENSK